MSNNPIDFPPKPFYIMSKIGGSNWVLTLTPDGGVTMRQLTGTIDQLWTATPDARGGAFLRHVSTGRVLAYQIQRINPMFPDVPAGPLQSANLSGSDPKQLWRREDLGDGWSGINAFLNWEGKVNVYDSNVLFNPTVGIFHWDGGADNEEWKLVEETGEVTVDSVTYDLAKAVADLGIPPSQGSAITVDNSAGGTPVTSTYSLNRTVTKQTSITHSESDTTGLKYTQTFSVKGGIEKVIEVSASSSFEESSSKTISLTDQKTNTESVTDTVQTQVSVPAGKIYSYNIIVFYGKVTVPYTAKSTFHSSTPGAAPVSITTTGLFTGVNSTNSKIAVADITAGRAQPKAVELKPVP
jgi:hypothetical protein